MALLLFVITIKMATIDIIILAMIGVGVIMGLMKGFVKQMASIVGLIAGLLMARALFGIVAERLAPVLGTSTTVAQVLAFILIWIAVPLGFAFVASLLTKALDAVHLGWLNRWLGSGLGALKYMILIGLAIHDIVKNNNILPKCFWIRFNFVPSSKSSHSAVNNDVSNNEPTQIAKVV